MSYLVAVVIAWFLAVLSVSAMPYVKVLGVTPDLALIVAGCWAVVRPRDEALIVVPAAGLIRDLVTNDPVGASVLAFAPLVILAAAVRTQPLDSDFLPAVLVVAAGSLAAGVIYAAVLALTGQEIDPLRALLLVIVPGAIVNALFTPIIYLPIRWLSPGTGAGVRRARRLTSPL